MILYHEDRITALENRRFSIKLLASGPFQNSSGGTFITSEPWNSFDLLMFEVGNRNQYETEIDMMHALFITSQIRMHDNTTSTNKNPEYAIDVFNPHTVKDIYFRSDFKSIFIRTAEYSCIFRVFGIKL